MTSPHSLATFSDHSPNPDSEGRRSKKQSTYRDIYTKISSINVDATFLWALVDDSYLGKTNHDAAVDVMINWHSCPSTPRIAIMPPADRHYAPPSPVSRRVEDAFCGRGPKITKQELNTHYEKWVLAPESEEGNLWTAIAAYTRHSFMANQCRQFFDPLETEDSPTVEVANNVDDTMSQFVLYLRDEPAKDKYVHRGQLKAWIAEMWTSSFFRSVKRDTRQDIKKNPRIDIDDMNSGDPDSKTNTKHYDRCVGSKDISLATHEKLKESINDSTNDRAVRRLESLNDPNSQFNTLTPTTKVMLRNLAMGMKKKQAAEAAGISVDHANKLLNALKEKQKPFAIESLNACSDDDEYQSEPTEGTGMALCPSIDGYREDESGVLVMLQACADPLFEPLLGVPEASALLCIHPKTLQALARDGKVPCTKLGKYWRFRASALDAWIQQAIELEHQSRRVG